MRKISMIGKIQVTKSIIIPQITYLYSVLLIPKTVLNELNQIIYNFIWDGKKEKIKRKTMIRPYHTGGLNVLDIENHAKTMLIKWIIKLTDKNGELWKEIPKMYLNKFGGNLLILKMNLNRLAELPNIKEIPVFYQNLIKIWIEINNTDNQICIINDPNKLKKQI